MTLSVDITKRLGDFSLRAQFETENEVFALLGASGSGKSMTLKCIAGIETPDQGHIVLDGVSLFDSEKGIDLPPQKRRIGYLFQNYALFPNMTIEKNIQCSIRDKNKAEKHQIALEMLHTMRLEGNENKYPHELSWGQQQRAALARILVNEPNALLLDEPFSALDAHLKRTLERELKQIIREFGKPVLFVSHDREETYRLAGKIAILNDGKLETCGERENVFRHPATVNGARLTGFENISAAEYIDDSHVYAEDWDIVLESAAVPKAVKAVAFRMTDVSLSHDGNSIRCLVEEAIEDPFTVTILLRPLSRKASGLIAFSLSKEQWRNHKASELSISLPPESAICLIG